MPSTTESSPQGQSEKTEELVSLFKYLRQLLKNPIEAIGSVPKIRFSIIVLFQFILCCISVVISNLLAPYAINLMTISASIVASFIGLSVLSTLFYYFFSIFFNRELSFRSLFTLILFCNIPFAICHILYYYFPPIDLIGFGMTSVLMVVGLVENYQISKKAAVKIMGFSYLVFAIFWIGTAISNYKVNSLSQPQTLDAIESELNFED